MASANDTEVFQHYQVLKKPDGALWELGRGAMGITYKAFDTNLRCDVALKVINALHLDSETARARFLREARAAAGLRHRNVASVYHLGNDDQSFFYAMEFVDGETVESLIKEEGPMAPTDALQIIVQIARALGAAAKQNLVHRDIKPANIMVTLEDDEEEQFVVKVIDFGLARPALGGEGSAHITMGGFVGTPQFASPEQLEEKDLDARSDIYSLGVTLWFMLAGKPPFTGPLGSVFIQQLTKEPPWAQLTGAPQPVLTLLANMLQKDPDKRPQTPVELRRQIEACLRQLPASERQLGPSTPFVGEPTSAESVTGSEAPMAARSTIWTTGSILAGRYKLAEQIGEGTNGRVFLARDQQQGEARVAIKILRSDVLASSAERRRVEGELEKLRASPHPYLLDFHALREEAETSILIGEWVNGFTLVDLLRSRGQLPLSDTLRLVAQAAVAADHARACDLRRLELSLHQIMTAFENTPSGDTVDSRAALTTSLSQWPPFSLKLDALGITREAGDSVTWGGDMTMMPSAEIGRDTQTSIRGLVEGSDLFSLGMIVYELLSGAPPALSQRGAGREARYVALPALNEAANMVLRRVLSPNPRFASNVEFFKALVDASGLPQNFIDPQVAAVERDPFAVERLPTSGAGAEDAGATLILEDGESISADEPVTARGPSAAERAEAQRLAEQQAAAEQAEQERVRAERQQARQAEAERIRAQRAEAKRIAAEHAEAERIAAEQVAAERAEAERIEAERLEAERAEARRLEAEQKEAQRIEAKRLAAERAEAERLENERVAAARAETKRLEAERRAVERAEEERIAAERAEAERIEVERLAAARAEAKRLEAERQAVERAKEERLAAERAAAKRIEDERLAAERAEAKRLEAERLEAERIEAERVRAEKAEAKRIETERVKAEKAEAERVRAERVEAKRVEAEKLKAEKAAAKRLQAEQAEAEKARRAAAAAEAAAMRDVAGVSSGEVSGDQAEYGRSAAKGNGKLVMASVGGVVLLGIIGAVLFSGGHKKEPEPNPAAKTGSSTPLVQKHDGPPVEPSPASDPTATVPTPEPTPEMARVEPTAAPEPSATPILAEASPAMTPAAAPTPEPVNKRDDEDTRNANAERSARRQEEKKRRDAEAAKIAAAAAADADAERAAKREQQKERERDRDREASHRPPAPEPEPKKPTIAKVKPPADKPKPPAEKKPTAAPASTPRPAPFILR